MAEKQDDLNLPAAVVTRIIKDALPEGCNIAKEAKLALTRAASVFVLYMTAQANNVAAERNKKTISDQDVLEALRITEFGRFEDDLKEALAQHRQAQKNKKDKKQDTSVDESNRMDDDDVEVEEVPADADMEDEEEEEEESAS